MEKELDKALGKKPEAVEDHVPTLGCRRPGKGARRLLLMALAEEVAQYIEAHAEARDEGGRRLVVPNGRAQDRTVTCGAGTMEVRARQGERPADGRRGRAAAVHRAGFLHMRRSPQVSEVLPILKRPDEVARYAARVAVRTAP